MQSSYKNHLSDLDTILVKVKERSKLLIDQGVWDSITHNRLDDWMSNFVEPESRFLSALLLDQFALRSSSQTESLIRHGVLSCLPRALCDNPIDALNELNYLNVLRNREGSQVKLVPVIRDQDPPTKSGPSVARLYKRHLKVSDNNFIWPWKIKENYESGVRVFVFIDDVLASGNQFSEFIEKMNFEFYEDARFVYVPFVAHEIGLDNVRKRFDKIKVCPVERVSERNSFFERPVIKEISDISELYEAVSKEHLSPRFLKNMMYGYEGMAMTLSFNHATPNASLPLYWYESESFFPLVSR